MKIVEELKRRKVFRVLASYAVVVFVIMQLVEILFPIFNFPQWTQQFIVILLLLGFPVAAIFSWIFDKTPDGFIKTGKIKSPKTTVKNTTPFYLQKRNIILLVGVIGGIVLGRFGQNILPQPEQINDKSIAVLPFENLSKNGEDEYFADGMTEDILTELSKIKDLLVISRTTIMKYKGTQKTIKEIGKELGVANILEGSIRLSGNRVRITGQLINASNDQHLWAEKYDRDIEDIFSVQDEVANAIANALRIELSDEEARMISKTQTESIEAYDYYIKGRTLSYFYEVQKNIEAIEFYKKAIEIDPQYSLPYAGISRVRMSQFTFQFMDQDFSAFALKEAEEFAKKAVMLGPNEAETNFALGFFYNATQQFDLAFTSFNKAIMLNPSHAHAHDEIGDVYLYSYGDFDRAISWYDKALQRDRELVPAKWFKSEILLRSGQVKKSLKEVEVAILDHPNVTQFYGVKHSALMMIGKFKEAYEFIVDKNDLYSKEGRSLIYYQMLGLSLLELGKMKEFDSLIEKISEQKYSDLTHQKKYLYLLKLFKTKNYKDVISGFEVLNNSTILTNNSGTRRVLSDVFYYWRAQSFLELGEYQNALNETFRFRPVNNQASVGYILDHYWPKKDYIKGLAYEGLGDEINARKSYQDFLRVWSNADNSLPDIIDAKQRLENLR
jgi:TolB-like protein/Tfp pilus assembly protein PilF